MVRKLIIVIFVFFLIPLFWQKNKVFAVLPADGNGDGKVDGQDYVIWLNNYNKSTSNGQFSGDFDGSGFVDGQDYVLWLNAYGSTEPGNATSTPINNPSPTSSPVTPPSAQGNGIWISVNEVNQLPMSGSAWNNVKSDADSNFGSPNLADQDTRHNIRTMAAAIIFSADSRKKRFSRTGIAGITWKYGKYHLFFRVGIFNHRLV